METQHIHGILTIFALGIGVRVFLCLHFSTVSGDSDLYSKRSHVWDDLIVFVSIEWTLIYFRVTLYCGACAAASSCSGKDVNTCLLAFVFAHHHHQEVLIAAKHCKLELLDCSELDKTYKCLNKKGLSEPCVNSLDGIINKYIADLNIPCTVKEFNSHCPYVTQIDSKKARPTPPAASKGNGLIATLVGVLTSLLVSVGMK